MEESPVRNKTIANYNKVLETIYTKVQDHVKSIWVDDEKVTHQKIFYLLATRGIFFFAFCYNNIIFPFYFFFFF